MAPSIVPRDHNGGLLESEIATIVVAVAIVVILTVIIVSIISCIVRRRQTRKYKQAPNPNHYPTGEQARLQKLSDLERNNDGETHHQPIRYKSVAVHHSARPLHRLSSVNEEEEEANEMKRKSEGLRKDWKEWEATVRRDRDVSLESHPGLNAENAPLSPSAAVVASRPDSPPPRYPATS